MGIPSSMSLNSEKMHNIRDLLTFSDQEVLHTGPGTGPATLC